MVSDRRVVRGPWQADDWDEAPLSPIRLRYPAEIEGPPPAPRWIVDNMLLPGTVTLMAGASNIGKTLAMQQMLTAVALGIAWMGRATEQARCLAVFGEDRPAELDRRQIAIAEHYDVHTSILDREFAWDAREDRDSILWQTEFGKGKPTEFWYQLFGGRPGQKGVIAEDGFRVLLLDTAAAMFAINHNDVRQVNAAMRALVREAVRHQIAIILNAHPSRGDPTTFGGSGQWIAASRFAFNLARPAAPPGMTDEEMRYGAEGDQRIFRGLGSNYTATPRPERWLWKDGVFVIDESAVDQRWRPQKSTYSDQERIDIAYRLLTGAKRAMQHSVSIPADVTAARSLPKLARSYGDAEIRNVPYNVLNDAQAWLIEGGHLAMVRVGTKLLIRPADMRYEGEN